MGQVVVHISSRTAFRSTIVLSVEARSGCAGQNQRQWRTAGDECAEEGNSVYTVLRGAVFYLTIILQTNLISLWWKCATDAASWIMTWDGWVSVLLLFKQHAQNFSQMCSLNRPAVNNSTCSWLALDLPRMSHLWDFDLPLIYNAPYFNYWLQ